ncbi:four helix bundle protein [Candidatus Amesbacteria bacterium]|nr:four helix bundle protein [Candidatus Amesbacteria bacterium]
MFKFQRLEVWKKSIELGKIGFKIAEDLPPKHQYSFGDQLRRALLSISNNIAEGSGRESLKEQSNFYNMAKGSVYEICKMLSGLIKRKNAK